MAVRRKGLISAVLVVFMILFSQSAGAIATNTDSNYQNESSNKPTPKSLPTAEDCSQSVVPQLSQSRLYAPETQITTEEPGRISGGFQAPASVECPIRVVITLRVPSGIVVSESYNNSKDWGSGGGGLVQTSFTVQPGEIQSISADVYRVSTQQGEFTITGDISYWPVGLVNQSQEIDGISLTFQSTSTPAPPRSLDAGVDFGVGLLLLFITTTIVLGMLLYYDSSVKVGMKQEDVDLKDLIAIIAAIFGILAALYALLIS